MAHRQRNPAKARARQSKRQHAARKAAALRKEYKRYRAGLGYQSDAKLAREVT